MQLWTRRPASFMSVSLKHVCRTCQKQKAAQWARIHSVQRTKFLMMRAPAIWVSLPLMPLIVAWMVARLLKMMERGFVRVCTLLTGRTFDTFGLTERACVLQRVFSLENATKLSQSEGVQACDERPKGEGVSPIHRVRKVLPQRHLLLEPRLPHAEKRRHRLYKCPKPV